MKKRTAPEIIAFHFGCDINDVREGRYQTYANPSIYVIGSDYFAVARVGEKEPRHNVGQDWERVGSYYGRDVWRSKMEGK